MKQKVITKGFETKWKDLDLNSDLGHTPTMMKQYKKYLIFLI